jgi:sRNA-binding carbon storage regulator CsrA
MLRKGENAEGDTVILETSDGPIEVPIAGINGSQSRVGFKAPKSVGIVRGELKERDQNALETPADPDHMKNRNRASEIVSQLEGNCVNAAVWLIAY